MKHAVRGLSLVAIGVFLCGLSSLAQESSVKPLVLWAVKHDRSPNLRDIHPSEPAGELEEEEKDDFDLAVRAYPGPYQSFGHAKSTSKREVIDPVLQSYASPSNKINLGLSFDGVAHNGWIVGDPNLAVGATQVVQWVNTRYAVYNKTTGATQLGPLDGNTLWSGFGGSCQTRNSGDPVVQYDKAAKVWVMMQHATPPGGPYYLCVAVSTTSDATGSYNRYAFQVTDWPDYAKLGVWSDGYYVSYDNFVSGQATTSEVCSMDRASMLTGASASMICFGVNSKYVHLLPSDLDGSTAPPSGSPNYYINLGTDSINLWQFHVDFKNSNNSTFTGPTNLLVANFTQACSGGHCVPQLGTSQQLDSLSEYPMYRFAYRNFTSHESLVFTHSVGSPSGVRWYEIRDPGSGPFVYQHGTYSPDSNWRWMGSAAMDSLGDIALGYSLSSSTMNPAIAYTGRLTSDPLGMMEGETVVLTGNGSETTGNYRWDDYTSLSIDPVDDCTFWYTNEYYSANSSTSWNTHINSFSFSACTAPK